jgi:hypothetical protein
VGYFGKRAGVWGVGGGKKERKKERPQEYDERDIIIWLRRSVVKGERWRR